MHLRATRAGAQAVRARGTVRDMSLAMLDAPLIAGLDYRSGISSARLERMLVERLDTMDLAPFRFHGWLGNRKTKSFGWRYDFDDASFSPAEPIPEWLLPLRDKAAGTSLGWNRPNSSMSCWPATTRTRALAGIGIATFSTRWSAFHSRHPPFCGSGSGHQTASNARASMSRRVPATCCQVKHAGNGSTGSLPATGCVFQSPSGPCRILDE